MQPFVEEGDGIIFFLQEAEFSRCASIGSRMCYGEDISSIEIIEILQILRDIGSCHRVSPYPSRKLIRFFYFERVGGFGMENGFQVMGLCLHIESDLGTGLFRRKRSSVFHYHLTRLPIALAVLVDLDKLQRLAARLVREDP